jgi:hypothetical protein
MNIAVLALDSVDPRDLLAIRCRMTRADSEWQAEVSDVLRGEASSITPVALCHKDGGLVGWSCSHVWRDMQTLEQWVDEKWRCRGIASALSSALIAHGTLDRGKPIAVFSEPTHTIAVRLGFDDVRHYRRDGADWVQV